MTNLPRRADYGQLTSVVSSGYLLWFCSHRWVQNEQVAKRAREIFEKIKENSDLWKELPKSKQSGRGIPDANTSYGHLCQGYNFDWK